MFEIGKKYIHKNGGAPYECLAVTNDQVCLKNTSGSLSIYAIRDLPNFVAYDEPVYAYINVWEHQKDKTLQHSGQCYYNRKAADHWNELGRVGCMKVKLERRYDD